jgi:hypothetical protein
MSEDRPDSPSATIYTYDAGGQLTDVRKCTDPVPTSEQVAAAELRQESAFSFEHDAQRGIFRLTWADGNVEAFRDKPARHLIVELDPATGEMKPVVKRGKPTFLYLCREEREVR